MTRRLAAAVAVTAVAVPLAGCASEGDNLFYSIFFGIYRQPNETVLLDAPTVAQDPLVPIARYTAHVSANPDCAIGGKALQVDWAHGPQGGDLKPLAHHADLTPPVTDTLAADIPTPPPGTTLKWAVRAEGHNLLAADGVAAFSCAFTRRTTNFDIVGRSVLGVAVSGTPVSGAATTPATTTTSPPTVTQTQTQTVQGPPTVVVSTQTVPQTVTQTTTAPTTTVTQAVTTPSSTPPGPAGLVPNFTFTPSAPAAETPVTFDASSSTANGGATIVSYAWQFGPSGFAFPSTATGKTQSVTFLSGLYSVRLTVTDSLGRQAAIVKQVSVDGSTTPRASGARPRAAATPPPLYLLADDRSPRAHAPVTLTVADTTGARRANAFLWDLDGDGHADHRTTRPSILVVFGRGGVRTVNLRVIRDDASTQTTRLVLPVRRAARVPIGTRLQQHLDVDLHSRGSVPRRVATFTDHGTLSVALTGRTTEAATALLAPLAQTTVRSTGTFSRRSLTQHSTYLLSSTLMPGRLCLQTTTHLRAGRTPITTVRTLGATGNLRRIALGGRFTTELTNGVADFLLSGPATIARGAPRPLPPACRGLR